MLTPLVDDKQMEEFKTINVLKEILAGTASFGLRGVVVALHYAGNGLILSSLGSDAAAAASLVTTIQGVTIATSSGFLTSTGLGLASALADKDQEAVSALVKTGWTMSAVFGALTAAALLSTKATLPFLVAEDVALQASTCLQYFSIAAFPDLLIWTNGHVVFQIEKNSWFPLVTNMTYRLPSLALSYTFAKVLNMGSMGVGLGSAVSGWFNILLLQFWFSRAPYRGMSLYHPYIPNFSNYLKKFFSSGWLLALQRITEWGNLELITQIVGLWSSQGLIAEQLSILLLNICGLLSQGVGQASMLMAKRNTKEMERLLKDYKETRADENLQLAICFKDKNKQNFYLSNMIGVILSLVLGLCIYALKDELKSLYVPEGVPDSTLDLVNVLLLINVVSLVPDAIRVVSGGTLRGWSDILFPTMVSLLVVSGLGIPAGVGWGIAIANSIMPLFVLRAITMGIAGVINWLRINKHMREDDAACNVVAPFLRTLSEAQVPLLLTVEGEEQPPTSIN